MSNKANSKMTKRAALKKGKTKMCIDREEFVELRTEMKGFFKMFDMHLSRETLEMQSIRSSMDRLSKRIWGLVMTTVTSLLGLAAYALTR